jgi:diaminopimelate decarboxylase
MKHFRYRAEHLFAEDVSVRDIAEQFGTPCYVYSRTALTTQWQAFDSAFGAHPHRICYAVKANSNLAVLNVLARLGSGFDIVSVGELERVLAAGGSPDKIIFSGVGKQAHEMVRALEVGIHCFNVESAAELVQLDKVASELNKIAPISLRVNPDVDAGTHPYISTGLKENKFGIPRGEALKTYQLAASLPHLKIIGIDYHIGSQLTELAPFISAIDHILSLIDELANHGIKLQHIDLGGGLGVCYRNEEPPSIENYVNAMLDKLRKRSLEVIVEPGRAIAANAGILLTRVEYLKHTEHKNFAIVDAAMNDLLRPALYGAWQDIIPAKLRDDIAAETYDVVGPVCETGDFLAKERALNIEPGDLLAIKSSGAYGFAMSSNYNTRPRAAEVMVDGDKIFLARPRETVAELFASERILPK